MPKKVFEEGVWPRWTERVRQVQEEATTEYVEEVIEQAQTDYSTYFGVITQHCESPIEALFVAAFIPYMLRSPDYHLIAQAEFGQYRVDFLVTFRIVHKGVVAERWTIVECDGHDYHERTKEQAERDKARDRAITSLGYPVFRFTGRELHRDPAACVEEVIDFTQSHQLDEMNAELGLGLDR